MTAQPVTPKGRRTREALLDAAELIAEDHGLRGLTVASVIERAGVAKGTFYQYFPDLDACVDALHQRFYTQVSDAVGSAVAGLTPGRSLLTAAITAYLDTCLAHRAVKMLVQETRAQPNLTTTMAERESLFASLAQPSLKAMGFGAPDLAARLVVALCSEAALIELEAGRRVPAARTTITRLLGRP